MQTFCTASSQGTRKQLTQRTMASMGAYHLAQLQA